VCTASELGFNSDCEISQWKDQLIESEAEARKLSSRVNELIDQMTALKANHEKERNSLASEIEIMQLREKELESQLSVVKSALKRETEKSMTLASMPMANKVRMEAEIDRLRSENERFKSSIEAYEASCDELVQKTEAALSKHNDCLNSAIDELRKDVVAIRETMQATSDNDKVVTDANFDFSIAIWMIFNPALKMCWQYSL